MGSRKTPAEPDWYSFKAQAGNPASAELHIFGPIGGDTFFYEEAITGKAIAEKLDALPEDVKTIRVLVNSTGGSVFDALHIANALRRQREEMNRSVEVEVEALAASAATIITSAGNSIRVPKNALMMIHNPTAAAVGDASLMLEMAAALEKIRGSIIATYRWVSKLPAKKLAELMDATTWMTADEALANGFATEVSAAAPIAAELDMESVASLGEIPDAYRDTVLAMVKDAKNAAPPKGPETAPPQKVQPDVTPPDGEDDMSNPKGTPPAADAEAKAQARAEERTRVLGIQNAVKVAITAGADKAKADAIGKAGVDGDSTVDAVREQLFEILATASSSSAPSSVPAGDIQAGDDERDKRRRGIAAALWKRAGVTDTIRSAAKKVPENPLFQSLDFDPGEFRGMSLLDHARESLERDKQGSTRGKSKMEIAGAFCNSVGIGQSTSDFAVAFEEALHKELVAAYVVRETDWQRFSKIGSVTDFRAHNRYYQSFLSRLDQVGEDGEFKNKNIPDAVKEIQQAATYGNILALTRQAIVNDDMGIFTDNAKNLGRAAALSIELGVFELLALNSGLGPAMNDTNTLFHASHNNVGGGAAIAVSALDADRVVMANQTDPSGNEKLNLRPAILVIPIGLGGAARVINNAQYDTEVSSKFQVPNKVVGLFRDIVDTPYLTGTRRYLFADPSIAPVIEVAFLEGEQEPFMEMKDGWRIDGVEWKVRHDFGIAAIDFRGAVTDAGA